MRSRRFLTEDRRDADDEVRFAPLDPECKVVQFARPLTPAECEKAAAIMRGRPDVELYAYRDPSRNLDFLRHFRELRRLNVQLYELDDISGLAQVPGLTALTFGNTRRRFSLRFLDQLPDLERLFLVGHRDGIAAVQKLSKLTSLGLSRITLPDLQVLQPLVALREVSVLLGGTRNLDGLASLPNLQRLFLMRITRLADLAVLVKLEALRSLRLDWMRNVVSLPSFAPLSRLEHVRLDTMKGLTDLAPIAAAPALRRLGVVAMPQLTADSFHPFVGHPTLAELHVATGRKSVNEEVRRMFAGIAR
ncbi:MAG: hypothetical protein ACM3JG_11200 [Thiohalocapsa sp.]